MLAVVETIINKLRSFKNRDEDIICEMANLPKRITKLDKIVHIWSDQKRGKHGSRIKVYLIRPGKNQPSIELYIDKKKIIIEHTKNKKISKTEIRDIVRFYDLNKKIINNYSTGGDTIYLDTDELNDKIIPFDGKNPESEYIIKS